VSDDLAADGLPARRAGAWTWEKLHHLRKYATAFMTAMAPKRDQGKWERLVYIDPLCGPGKDIDVRSGQEFPGSPLIAIDTRPRFDHLFFGDIEATNVDAVRRRIPGEDVARISLQTQDCHERVRDVVAQLSRRVLGLAFVDPQAFEVRFELFETLAGRAVDIVFLFPSGAIVRNLRRFVASTDCKLDDLWGGRQWRKKPIARLMAQASAAGHEPDEQLYGSWARAFCERVSTLGYTRHDVVDPLRNDQGAPMYHLLFFSKNEAGLTIWRNVRKIEPRGQRRLSYDG
jgi:three-Cys-motif partner protein